MNEKNSEKFPRQTNQHELALRDPASNKPGSTMAGAGSPNRSPDPRQQQSSFKQFSASELFCPKCNKAMPVREKMLLVLSTGTLYDLTCVRCHTSLGTRTA